MLNVSKVKALCKQNGITQTYICKKIGMGKSYFTQVQTYNLNVTPENIKIIADCLHTTVEYLTDQTDDPEPPVQFPPPQERQPDGKLMYVDARAQVILNAFLTVDEEAKARITCLCMTELAEHQKKSAHEITAAVQ